MCCLVYCACGYLCQSALVSQWKNVAAAAERAEEEREEKALSAADQLRRARGGSGSNANLIPISDEWKLKLAASRAQGGAEAAESK